MSTPRRARGGKAANDAGAAWEYRLARLRFGQGFFVRRSIDVWPEGPDALSGNKLAEIDLLCLGYDGRLRRRAELVEAKSGSGGSGEVDRIMWLRGMSGYCGADDATFAKLRLDPRVRPVARRSRVSILDEAAVGAAEKSAGIGRDDWVGFADPVFGENVIKPAREHLNSSVPLRRAGKFLWGTFWMTDEFSRIKQLRTLAELLRDNQRGVDPAAFALAAGELVSLTAISTLDVARWRGQYEPHEFLQFVTTSLSSGPGNPASTRRLLAQIDALNRDFVETLHDEYTAAGVARISRRVPRLETELLRAPDWADAFGDLSARVQDRAPAAMHALRLLDLRTARRLGSTRPTEVVTRAWAGQQQQVEDLANIVEKFCSAVWGLPSLPPVDLGDPATARSASASASAAASVPADTASAGRQSSGPATPETALDLKDGQADDPDEQSRRN